MAASAGKPRKQKPAPTPRQLAGLLWRALWPLFSCLVRLLALLFLASAVLLTIDQCGH